MKLADLPHRAVKPNLEAEEREALRSRQERAERARERMKRLNADPEFAARHKAAARERMKRLHADPEFERYRIVRLRAAFKARQSK